MAKDLSYPGAGYTPRDRVSFLTDLAKLGYPGRDYYIGADPVYISLSPFTAAPGSTVTIAAINPSAANPPVWIGGNQPIFVYLVDMITFIAPVIGNYTVGGLSFTST